jgi:hypothetical protein
LASNVESSFLWRKFMVKTVEITYLQFEKNDLLQPL